MAVVQPEMEGGLWMHGSPTDDWRLRGDPAEGEEEKEKPSSPQAAPTLRIEGGLPQDSRSKGKKKERAPKKFCLKDSDFLFFLNSDFSLKNPDIFPLKIPIPPLSNSIFFFKKNKNQNNNNTNKNTREPKIRTSYRKTSPQVL